MSMVWSYDNLLAISISNPPLLPDTRALEHEHVIGAIPRNTVKWIRNVATVTVPRHIGHVYMGHTSSPSALFITKIVYLFFAENIRLLKSSLLYTLSRWAEDHIPGWDVSCAGDLPGTPPPVIRALLRKNIHAHTKSYRTFTKTWFCNMQVTVIILTTIWLYLFIPLSKDKMSLKKNWRCR